MSRRCLLLFTFLAACAPDNRAVDPDDAGAADGGAFIDAARFPDAGPDDYIVYVHSKDTLYRMDSSTFALTPVGGFDAPAGDLITDLAVATDGTIYVISKTKLYTADPDDGHVSFVASLSSSPTGGNVGLTFLPDGKLLATDSSGGVRSVEPSSGHVDEIGNFGMGLATAGDLVAVADGTMYAISDKGPGGTSAFANNWLLTVDTQDGHADTVGQIGAKQVFGAAFINGKVLVFTKGGQVYQVDPHTGAGTLKASTGIELWGAGVTPLVPPVE
jgi:hypothetical protein